MPSLRTVLRQLYEPLMALVAVALALTVVLRYGFTLDPEIQRAIGALEWLTWGVFAADTLARLALAKDRRLFCRRHFVDFIAVVPLGLFGPATPWFSAVRALIMLRRYSDFFHTVFLRHGFAYVCLLTFGLVLTGAFAIQHVEPGLGNFGDALWWSFVTTTTVGYGDIAPKTGAGRMVAVALMLLGIGFIGLFTGTVATFFVERSGRRQRRRGPLDAQIDLIRGSLDHLDELSADEFAEVQAALHGLREAQTRLRGGGP